jgi:hypothetical protein
VTLDKALGFAIDYGKFIATLWNYYVLLILALIGWLITLRSKDLPLDNYARFFLIAGFIGISIAFALVLAHNHQRFSNLMQVVQVLANIEAELDPRLQDVYRRVFVASESGRFLGWTLFFLPVSTIIVGAFMWFITKPKHI